MSEMTDRLTLRLANEQGRFLYPQQLRELEKLVRILLSEAREPIEEMCGSGYTAACEHDHGETVPSAEIAPATWRAMIDEALK